MDYGTAPTTPTWMFMTAFSRRPEQMAVIEAAFVYNAATRGEKLPRKDLPPPSPRQAGAGEAETRNRPALPNNANQAQTCFSIVRPRPPVASWMTDRSCPARLKC